MKNKIASVFITAVVWALAGGIFGAIFTALHQVLIDLGLLGWQSLVVGGAVAAMTTGAFYGSMPVALIGAMAGMLGSIGTLMVVGSPVDLPVIAGVCGLTGLVVGLFHSWVMSSNAGPLGVLMTGLIAGSGAGALMAWGLHLGLIAQPAGPFVIAAGIVALVGSLFQLARPHIVRGCFAWIPQGLGSPVVAGVIAMVVGAAVGIMSGNGLGESGLALTSELHQFFGQVPTGFVGGMVGGAITGAILELLGVPLENEIENNL
jgi:hypothetical protein